MFLVELVCLFVCLFVCGQHYSKSYEPIGMKFYGRVLSSTSKNCLNFGGDLGVVRWVNEQKYTVIVVAYPDRGAGNDSEPFFFFFFFFFRRVGSLSQQRLNIFTVGNMGVMICLGQGGLRSLSASSYCGVFNYNKKWWNGGFNFISILNTLLSITLIEISLFLALDILLISVPAGWGYYFVITRYLIHHCTNGNILVPEGWSYCFAIKLIQSWLLWSWIMLPGDTVIHRAAGYPVH